MVGDLVEVIVDNLSEVNKRALLDLDFTFFVSLDSGGMNNS